MLLESGERCRQRGREDRQRGREGETAMRGEGSGSTEWEVVVDRVCGWSVSRADFNVHQGINQSKSDRQIATKGPPAMCV